MSASLALACLLLLSSSAGALPSGSHTTAALQLRGPHAFDTDALTRGLSPHTPAEAGIGVRLPTSEVSSPRETAFEATLSATTSGGEPVVRRLRVPVEILPIVGEAPDP